LETQLTDGCCIKKGWLGSGAILVYLYTKKHGNIIMTEKEFRLRKYSTEGKEWIKNYNATSKQALEGL
jgi:hypothetical protein